MTDSVTLTGVVATKPINLRTTKGLTVANFRLASSQRRFDRATGTWVEGETNWYTVNAYRRLANNVANSLDVGQRVVVSGRLRVRNWSSGERRGTSIEVDAEAVGHDLTFGVSHFTRLQPAAPADSAGAPSNNDRFGSDSAYPSISPQQGEATTMQNWAVPGSAPDEPAPEDAIDETDVDGGGEGIHNDDAHSDAAADDDSSGDGFSAVVSSDAVNEPVPF